MSKAKKPAKEAIPSLVTRKLLLSGPNRQIFIIDDADRISDVNAVQCVSLPHPKHNKPCRYLHTNKDIWEVQRVYQPPSSWFIQYDVQEDGSFYVCTRIDPLFLILPLLEKGRKKTADHEGYFLQMDQLISKAEFPHILLASNTTAPASSSSSSSSDATPPAQAPSLPLGHELCDIRPGWNESVVRLNDDKVVAWLRSKVERMRHAFKQVRSLQHHYTYSERNETAEQETERLAKQREEKKKEAEEAAKAAEGEGESKKEEVDQASPAAPVAHEPVPCGAKQALVFLSEYLPAHFFTLLCSSYKLTPEEVFEKKKATKTESWETTRVSGDIDTSRPAGAPSLFASNEKRKAEKPMSTTAKKLATAAKGTKSLASFFAKK